jgi:hypothetical protein
MDGCKLRIAIRMRGTLLRLTVGLQAVLLLVSAPQPAYGSPGVPGRRSSARFRTLLPVHRSGD